MIKITSKKVIPKESAVREHDKVKQFLDPTGMYYAFEIDKDKVKEYAIARVQMSCEIQATVDEIKQDIDDSTEISATVILADGVVIASTSSYNDVLACVTEDSDVQVMEPAVFGYIEECLRNKYITTSSESGFIDLNGWCLAFTKYAA